MRVGLMTREYPPYVYGGAGVHVEYLSRELAKSIAVEVHAWGETPEADSLHDPQLPHLPNLSVHFNQPWPLISHGTDAKFKGALEALSLNLLQNLHLDKLDIIHTHTWYVSMAGFLAKMLYNIPFVLTTHSLEPLRAWKAEQLGSGYALSSWMERTAILAADAIIAVSNGTRADILKAYPDVSPDRIHVIYNGIDLNQYQYTSDTSALTKYGVDLTRPYVLFVGRITRQKGVTHLVDAVAHLPPGTQVVLCAGAPDTPEIATEMRDKVAAAKAAGANILWIEAMVTKAEAIQLYSHCAVFACPSVYEPFGIINLEAMACGAPVVASATGGILEVVIDPTFELQKNVSSRPDDYQPTHDVSSRPEAAAFAAAAERPLYSSTQAQPSATGHLVPFTPDPTTGFPTDPAQFSRDLASAIATVLNDPEKAKAMGAAGRKRVEDHFSWTAIAAQTIELYQSLIAKTA